MYFINVLIILFFPDGITLLKDETQERKASEHK